jgi:hypothetical protein
MALHLCVFVLLLLVCLLLLLVRLGRLGWFSLQPFSSKGVAKRSRLHRSLCPALPTIVPSADSPPRPCRSEYRPKCLCDPGARSKADGEPQTHTHRGLRLSEPAVSVLWQH